MSPRTASLNKDSKSASRVHRIQYQVHGQGFSGNGARIVYPPGQIWKSDIFIFCFKRWEVRVNVCSYLWLVFENAFASRQSTQKNLKLKKKNTLIFCKMNLLGN